MYIIVGCVLIPGEAIKIRLKVTAVIPFLAATLDSPILRPFSSTTGTPSWTSLNNAITYNSRFLGNILV